MESNESTTAATVNTVQSPEPVRVGTKYLLACGVVAGPFYLLLGVVQGLVREGFDFERHPLSVLANGPGGWVQTVNFVLSGALVIAAAMGMARVLGMRRLTCWFLAGFGLCMILAAIFPADPVDGFPPGTPEGFPTSVSTTGLIHFIAGGVGFLFLGISALAASWTMHRRSAPALAGLSLICGLAVLVGFFGTPFLPVGIAGIWFAVVAGWLWLAVLSAGLRRQAGL